MQLYHRFLLFIAVARDLPLGYRLARDAPLLRGGDFCRYCLLAPCIIVKPPEFLRGSCDPHPANAEKRHMLYRKFWRCLKALGVWRDEEYLQRKEFRTARDDKRDVMPDCVIRVGRIILFKHPFDGIPNLQEIRRRYPSEDGLYRDYISTFDASMDIDVMDVMEDDNN